MKGATPITLFRLLAAAAVAVTAVLAPAAALARQPSPDEQLTKAVAARSVSAEVSANWSGYAVTVSGTTFTSVTGTWVQPAVDCTNAVGATYSAFWVGLGGALEGSNALEQVGTDSNCRADGTPVYSAWYELVPAPSKRASLKVFAGDTITGTVTVKGTKVTMRLENDTRGTSFTKVATVAAPDTSSAEWIAEAPSACTSSGYCQVLPLADFGKVRFTKASATTADGHTGTISDPAWTTAAAIDLQVGFAGPRFNGPYATSERGEATTSALSNGGRSFSVRWREVAPVDPTTVPGGPWSYGFG